MKTGLAGVEVEGVEGEKVSRGGESNPGAPLRRLPWGEGPPSVPPLEEPPFLPGSSLVSLPPPSWASLLLPSPHSSLSRVGEEGVDGGGWCFFAFLLASLKLASGGRNLTPLRVEPSMAFCSWEGDGHGRMREDGGEGGEEDKD